MLDTLLLTAWIGCQSLDIGTTVYALQQPGYRETNPVVARGLFYPVKISVNVGAFLLWKDLLKSNHRTAARVIAGSSAASGCVAGGLNLRTLRK